MAFVVYAFYTYFVTGDIILSSGKFITLTPVQVYCIHRRLQIPIEACCKLLYLFFLQILFFFYIASYHDKDDITQLYDLFYQLQKLKVQSLVLVCIVSYACHGRLLRLSTKL